MMSEILIAVSQFLFDLHNILKYEKYQFCYAKIDSKSTKAFKTLYKIDSRGHTHAYVKI
eukprot:UN09556